MDDHDVEKGFDLPNNNNTTPPSNQPNTHTSRNPHFRSELEIFQGLVGIKFLKPGGEPIPPEDLPTEPSVHPFLTTFFPSLTKTARTHNRGIYNRAVTQDLKNRSLYTISRYIISGLYLLQILVAATLTALSASQSPSSTTALTVLGAINTVLAGLLAWLTGQGMPTRFRRARDQYREVVRAAEAMERRFAQIDFVNWPAGQRPDPVAERDKLVRLFDDARKDQQANYPETTQTPLGDQMQGQNEALRDQAAKWKVKRKELQRVVQRLRRQLEEGGKGGGKEVLEELVERGS